MEIEDVTKSIEIVNGEKLYLVDIEKSQVIDGVRIGGEDTFELLLKMKDFVKNHEGFSLALFRCKIGTTRWVWVACILYRINNMWQRVQIENIVCEYCGWNGKSTNPTVPSLYDTVKDRQNALNSAWNQPEVNCPICEKKLMRRAIWVQCDRSKSF